MNSKFFPDGKGLLGRFLNEMLMGGGKYLFFLLAILTSPFFVAAQGTNGELTCGTIIRPIPPVPFNNEPMYSDRFDNLYTHSELQEDMYNTAHHCDNIEDFVLNFIDDPAHPFTDAERERVCDVFTYLSTLIQRPLQGRRATISINKGDLPLDQGATGTAFFPNQCSVGHSWIHQVLFTGQGAGNLPHGRITINNQIAGFYTGADPGAIGANQFDFQTVVLHEALHVMGFGSQITPGGGPQGFFTLWDLNLRNAAGDYLVQSSPVASPDCCVRYQINTAAFGPDWDTNIWDQNCGLNNLRFDVAQLPPVNGEYPNAPMDVLTFRNVLSHLDRTCGSEHYVMNPGTPPGAAGVQRTLTATETAVLCRLGYNVGNACAPDCVVVAADDGPVYVPTGGTITIDVGVNDFPAPVLGAPPPNVTFNFLPNCGNASNITVVHQGGGVFRVLGGTVPGSYTFCYGISSCGGRRCDVGQVIVVVTNPAIATSCQNIGECELVSLGSFELFGSQQEMLRDLTAGAIEGRTNTGFSFGSFSSSYDNTPDLFSNPFGTPWACGQPFPGVTGINTPNGTRAAGMIIRNPSGTNMPEGMAIPLCRPVYPGMRGRVTFLAMTPNNCAQTQVRVEFSERPPVPGQVLYNNPGTVGPRTDVHITSHPNTNPVFGAYTVDFYNETNVCWNYLYLSALSSAPLMSNHGYLFLDDVQLTLENRFDEVFDLGGPTPAPAAPCPGQLVTVELSICNPPNCGQGGLYENPNIAVQATLPPGLSFVPSADFPGPTIIVSRGSIGLGQCRVLRFTARVDNDPALAGQTLPIQFTLNAACYRPLTMSASVTPTGTLATLSLQVAETSGTANDGILCQGSGASATITATTTGNAYLWSTGATTQSIAVAPSATQSYTVTVTGPGLCPNMGHVSIEVVPCGPSQATCDCPVGQGNYTVGTGTTSLKTSGLPDLIDGGCLVVRGRLVVDRGTRLFEIRNSTIIMDEGAEIEVAPDSRLKLKDNPIIRGCTRMWRGIRVQGELVAMGNLLIRDAEYAINLEARVPHPSTNISGNTFNRNYVAIYVPPLSPVRSATLVNPVHNNQFLCDGALLPVYAGQQAPVGDWALAGAYINDLGGGISFTGAKMGAGTLFEGTRNGVLAQNSILTVTNCKFRNLREIAGPVGQLAGAYNECVEVRNCARVTINQNTMDSCRVCVRSINSHLNAENNKINTIQGVSAILFPEPIRGFFFRTGKDKRVLVRRNKIVTRGDGINIGDFNPADRLSVLDNHITMTGGVATQGIYVFNCQKGTFARDTVTRADSLATHGVGINILNANACDFANNKLFNGAIGLTTRGGVNNYFVDNEAGASRPVGSTWRGVPPNRAYNVENSTEYYCRNISKRAQTGFYFRGDCTASDAFRCSDLWGNQGLFLWRGAVGGQIVETYIGTQEHTGNRWNKKSANAFHAGTTAGIVNRSQFIMRFDSIPDWNTGGGKIGPWFGPDAFGEDDDCSLCYAARYPTPPEVGEPVVPPVAAKAPEKSAALGEYDSPASNWLAQQHLYERLSQAPESVGSAPEFASFMAQSANAPLGKLQALWKKVEGEGEGSVLWRESYARLQDALTKALVEAQALRDAGASDMALLLKSADVGWYAARLADMEAARETAREAAVPALLAENAAIQAPNVLAGNEKTLNALVLGHRLWKGVRPPQTALDSLKSLADRCPFTDGAAVYRARGLYQNFEPDAYWAEDAGCSTWQGRTRRPQGPGAVVAPNPAKDRLYVSLSPGSEQDRRFTLFALSGAQAVEVSIVPGEHRIEVDIASLPPGIYFYTVSENGQLPFVGKVAIVR